jgi:ribosomal protein S7
MERKKKEEKYKPLQKTLTIRKEVLQIVFNGDRNAAVRYVKKAFAQIENALYDQAVGQITITTQTPTTAK